VLHHSPTPEPDVRVALLLDRLRRHGLHARLAESACWGERDLRICVRRTRLGPGVELLCSAADEPGPAQWHAVVIDRRDRTVWRGPACDGEPGDVLRFVEDLLDLDDAALETRYLRLG
jgi:hypothetical protein